MHVLGLTWVGTRTVQHDATVRFFHEVLGLEVRQSDLDFTVLKIPDGSTVEVFGPRTPYNPHISSPVAGFRVGDLSVAEHELRAQHVEIVLERTEGDTGAWLHFRAPDGHIYELTQEFA